MPITDNVNTWVSWMLANRAKVLYYARGLQILTGLIFLLLGWLMGHQHFHLLRVGTRTQGKIVGEKLERISRHSNTGSDLSDTANMPIVEFRAGDRPVTFEDWLGTPSPPLANTIVPVLYDASDPSVAMIDRKVMNWIPWAPISLVGLFLVLVGIKGLLKPPVA